MLETSGNAGNWAGAGHVLILDVKLYIYSLPGFEKALRRAQDREKTWRTLANLIGTHDIPALHRLFRNAKHRTWSVKRLLDMVQLSLDGKYLAKGYSDLEYNLATVVYELGGAHCRIFKNDMVHGSSKVTTRSFVRRLPSCQQRRKGWGYPMTSSLAL
jgi:hypothetical protein